RIDMKRFGQRAERAMNVGERLERLDHARRRGAERRLSERDGTLCDRQRLGRPAAIVQQIGKLCERGELMALQRTVVGLGEADRFARCGFRACEVVEALENLREENVCGY